MIKRKILNSLKRNAIKAINNSNKKDSERFTGTRKKPYRGYFNHSTKLK